MKILLFGKYGQVGWELNRTLLPLGEVVALGRQDVDLTEMESLRKIVRKIQPDVIVNAAAYTNVEKAESEQDTAYQINAAAPGVMADECQRLSALMVHYSTDYVFDGDASKPYPEDYEPGPLSVYGSTKNEGEAAIRNKCARHLIIRSSWIYASRGNNFVRTMVDLMKKKDILNVVSDQVGSPTSARFIADASMCMIRSAISPDMLNTDKIYGTYHLSASGKCSWYEFSLAIMDYLKQKEEICVSEIRSVSSEEYKTEAQRPRYSVLDNSKVLQDYAVCQVNWKSALRLCLDEMCI